MANCCLWMAKQDPTTGELTDIRLYAPDEQGGANLIELTGPPGHSLKGKRLKSGGNTPATVVEATSGLVLKVGGSPVTSIMVTADDVDTEVVAIEGDANAVVTLSWPGLLPISAAQITLDGSGDGSVTFGPTAMRLASAVIVRFAVPGAEAAPLGVLFS